MDDDANSELQALPPGESLEVVAAEPFVGAQPSATSMIMRRFIAGVIDASLIGAISALIMTFPAFNQISWSANVLPVIAAQMFRVCLAAFVIGFIDSVSACGWLLSLLGIVGLFSSVTVTTGWAVWVVPLLVNHLYHAVYESSAHQATPGKRAMGLVLCGALGQSLLPQRLMLRHCLKFPAFIFSCLPLVHVMTSKRSQFLHDVFVGSFVLPKECPRVVPIDDGRLTPDKAIVASVGRRIVASLLDSAVFCAIMQLVQAPIFLGLSRLLVSADLDNPTVVLVALYVLLPGVAALIAVLVFAAFEGSALQATPGKIVAGLKVAGQTGIAITFTQALAKQFNQGLAYLSLYPIFGFVWLVKLALPGAESALSLIGFFVFYLVYGSILCITFKSGQTLLDRICERYVLLDSATFSSSKDEPNDTVRLTESWRLDN